MKPEPSQHPHWGSCHCSCVTGNGTGHHLVTYLRGTSPLRRLLWKCQHPDGAVRSVNVARGLMPPEGPRARPWAGGEGSKHPATRGPGGGSRACCHLGRVFWLWPGWPLWVPCPRWCGPGVPMPRTLSGGQGQEGGWGSSSPQPRTPAFKLNPSLSCCRCPVLISCQVCT